MPAYRPVRRGDLLAVRSPGSFHHETQVVLDDAVDNGGFLYLRGRWDEKTVEVLIQRIGDIEPIDPP